MPGPKPGREMGGGGGGGGGTYLVVTESCMY